MSQAHYYQAGPDADFHLVRAARDVGVALLMALLFAHAMAKLDWLVDPDADGRGLAGPLAGIAVLALVASYGAQTHKRAVVYGAIAAMLALAVLLPGSVAVGAERASKGLALTAEERVIPSPPVALPPPVDGGTRVYRHCQEPLGFSLILPIDDFVPDPEIVAEADFALEKKVGKNHTAWWSWRYRYLEKTVTVAAARGVARSPGAFTRFAAGIRAAAVEPDVTVLGESLKTGTTTYSYELMATRSDGLARDLFCRSSTVPDETSPAVCVVTLAGLNATLRRLRESVEFGTCDYLLGPPVIP